MNPGLYVHVPFCRHRCHFCAFLITTHTDFLEDWVRAVVQEIEDRAGEIEGPVDTIYFGGGTPSLVPPEGLGAILAAARGHLDVTADAEVTLEANPDDLAPDDLAALHRLGVNRLSLGLQSTADADLRLLTRTHTAEQGLAAFHAAREAGFGNITIDLLYGLPGRSAEKWRERLHRALDLGPDHVSAYLLAFEPGTPFKRYRDTGRLTGLSPTEEQERFLMTRTWLEEAGYAQYEVSSYAREPRFESRHNKKYWEGAPYLGVGPAAHSFAPPVRSWNLAPVRKYVHAVFEGRSPEESRETLTIEQRRLEHLFLGLRTTRGIPLADFPDLAESPKLVSLQEEGLAVVREERLQLTPKGLAVADAVVTALN